MCTQLMVARTAIGAITIGSGTDPDGDVQTYGNEAEVPVAIKDVIRNSTHCCGAFFSTFSRAGKRIRPKGTKVFGGGCIG